MNLDSDNIPAFYFLRLGVSKNMTEIKDIMPVDFKLLCTTVRLCGLNGDVYDNSLGSLRTLEGECALSSILADVVRDFGRVFVNSRWDSFGNIQPGEHPTSPLFDGRYKIYSIDINGKPFELDLSKTLAENGFSPTGRLFFVPSFKVLHNWSFEASDEEWARVDSAIVEVASVCDPQDWNFGARCRNYPMPWPGGRTHNWFGIDNKHVFAPLM